MLQGLPRTATAMGAATAAKAIIVYPAARSDPPPPVGPAGPLLQAPATASMLQRVVRWRARRGRQGKPPAGPMS